MERRLKVKGVGKVSVKPDYVVISIKLKSSHRNYGKAMDLGNTNIKEIIKSITSTGFKKESIKTTYFSVDTDYEQILDYNGEYKDVFKEYVVNHNLKLSFDLEMDKISKVITAISECVSHPRISIKFTVKDSNAVNEEMLKKATTNARKKAEILCEATGAILGELINIEYNWEELNIFSHTDYMCCKESMYADINPDNIDISDTVMFEWEIK